MRALVHTVVVLVVAMAANDVACADDASVAYSADYIMETADGADRGKIFSTPGKERRESVTPDGSTMITIRRDDLQKIWMLMPAERMYMEMNTGDASPSGQRPVDPDDFQSEMTVVGPENLAGVDTIKHKVVMTGADGSKMGGFWWTTADGIPVKMDMIAKDGGSKLRLKRELSNLEIGPQAPELFEIPPGYNSMAAGLGVGVGKGLLGLPSGESAEQEPAATEQAEPPPRKKGFGLGTLKDALDKVR